MKEGLQEARPAPSEQQASEALQQPQHLSAAEQERLVNRIDSPHHAREALTVNVERGDTLTAAQKERLWHLIESDAETAYDLYCTLTLPEVELSETERGWLSRLENALAALEDPQIAAFPREHASYRERRLPRL